MDPIPRKRRADRLTILVMAAAAIFGASRYLPAFADGGAVRLPAPASAGPAADGASQTAVLAGGCFWGVQGVFEHVAGVQKVLAGYSGGEPSTAHYEDVSDGDTGHAESVQITFDPKQISYGQILQVFFSVALDPTQVDRQGPDAGTQYRSEIFYADASQRQIAEGYVADLDHAAVFHRPIATRIDPMKGFYPAEAEHQDYLLRNPGSPYILINDLPKVANLKRLFPDLYRETPVRALDRSGS